MTPPVVPTGAKILTVSELTRGVKRLLEEAFDSIWVAGEVTNYRPASSGHVYFSLKDEESQLRAVLWRSTASRLSFKPHDGLDVIARGRLDVYLPAGEYKLIVDELHPKGLGAQELALRQLKEKLQKLGYFAAERKKPLPPFPRRVALVTSPSGAAIRDMLEVLRQRWPALHVVVCPVRVQGEGAAAEMVAAIQCLNALHQQGPWPVDVLIVGRGGGSSEDLWAFNDETLAHAIFHSRIPVVSAVGHEIDLTIADLVADCRALTPTEAASRVVPDRAELLHHLGEYGQRLRESLSRRLERWRKQLEDLGGRRVFRRPFEHIHELEQRLDDLDGRLRRALQQRIIRARERLEATSGRLESLSPLNVLARGYSLTRREADRLLVRSPEQVRPGDRLVTDVHHGRIISRVEETQPATDAGASPASWRTGSPA